MIKAFALGLLSSLFFAVTFVLNRQMDVGGGHWIWTASLRFFFMTPMLFLILLPGRRYRATLAEIRAAPSRWLLWSSVGFGLFYAGICAASAYGPAWLVASTWQVTIVAGVLLTPLLERADRNDSKLVRRSIPLRQLVISLVILGGVVLVQVRDAGAGSMRDAVVGFTLVLVAAFAYPLGNRSMMRLLEGRLDTLGRVFGMTLCSLPLWIALSLVALAIGERPTTGQYAQTFVVALFAGVIATFLFFKATEMVR
ncbi:MAG: multidrug resistance efflux transporter family protein, partial [Spirochaetales bacterium]|nr:multidrug resistance efflux transporter family protein [Spirochaetales bacterium]